jgi:LPXTG-motif cell wall-anchored protein
MRRGHLGPLSVVVLLAAVLGVGVAQAQQTQTVSMSEFQFTPATLTATAGQPVNWTFRNEGQNRHDFRVQVGDQTIDAVPGDDDVILPGQDATLTFTFTAPGTFEFWCPVGQHRDRGMVGTLTVLAAGAGAAPAAQPKPGAPAAKPGPPAGAAAAQPKPGPSPAAQPKPAASPAAEAPRALPRTGEAESWAIGGLAVAAVALLGAGLLARRRGI